MSLRYSNHLCIYCIIAQTHAFVMYVCFNVTSSVLSFHNTICGILSANSCILDYVLATELTPSGELHAFFISTNKHWYHQALTGAKYQHNCISNCYVTMSYLSRNKSIKYHQFVM